MLIRQERPTDAEAVDAVHRAAFEPIPGTTEPIEVGLVRALRADDGWVPALSLVAEDPRGGSAIVGHVVCTEGRIGSIVALGLGPLGVLPDRQHDGVGAGLMHAVLGAADALGYPVVVLLGHAEYYPRFGFVPAATLGITPPDPTWGNHFQARPLGAWHDRIGGAFRYAAPFDGL